jgi:hypothetical protein
MTLFTIAIVIFGFYGRKPGEDPRIGRISRVLGALAVLLLRTKAGEAG